MNYLGAGTFNSKEQFMKEQFLLRGRRIKSGGILKKL
jgi:hypothetical protein